MDFTPEEYARVRQEIQDVIECYCDANGVDMHDPNEVYEHRHTLWATLEASGKLYPTMTYDAFIAAISVEMMRDQVRGGFFSFFGNPKPPTVDVNCEAKNVK